MTSGLHLTASGDACDAIVAVLRSGRTNIRFPLKPLAPEDDPTGFNEAFSSMEVLHIEVVDANESLRTMRTTREEKTVTIRVTRDYLPELIRAFQEIRDRLGDFVLIHKDSIDLWFW